MSGVPLLALLLTLALSWACMPLGIAWAEEAADQDAAKETATEQPAAGAQAEATAADEKAAADKTAEKAPAEAAAAAQEQTPATTATPEASANPFDVPDGEWVLLGNDLLWAGNDKTIAGQRVANDILAAGNSVTVVESQVGGGVRMAGRIIKLSGTAVTENVTMAGQEVTVEGGSANVVSLSGQKVNFSGTAKSVHLSGSEIFIDGVVNGDAFVYADKTFTQYAGELPSEMAAPKYSKKELKDYEIVNLGSPDTSDPEILFDLKNINVQFGDTVVLKNLNWTVRKGEHWAVMGENGAGKSTLLGMLTADHPQIYKNDITLLGERPGHGLNIWEHKAKLGFFSPELALQYREDLSLSEVLCTGFTSNLCKAENTTWEERAKAKEWLNYLGFEDVDARFRSLSPIDKRVVLMARAAIRPPKVLLLDEPTQGLKGEYREKIFNLLQLLSKETTIILVSHYEEEWPPCMTHLLRMPKFSM
jgi:ABC-type molybdenum transport system ATPase subunit/photorepair protein PhrA